MTKTKKQEEQKQKEDARHFLESELRLLDSFFSKKYTYLFFLLIFIIVAIIILNVRASHGVIEPIGYESTKQLHVAQLIHDARISGATLPELFTMQSDEYSVALEKPAINLFTIGLSYVLDVPRVLLLLMNLLLSVLAMFLFTRVLLRSNVSVQTVNLVIFVLAFTPALLFYALSLSILPFAAVLFMLGLLCLRRKKLRFVAYLIGALIVLLGVQMAISYLILVLAFSIVLNRMHLFYITLITQAIVFAASSLLHFSFMVAPLPLMTSQLLTQEIIADFGGFRGIGIMVFALFFFGFFRNVIQKRAFLIEVISLVLAIASFFYEFRMFYFVIFIISLLAADTLSYFFQSKWYSEYLKAFGLFVILCGILFTSVSYATRIVDVEPTSYELDAFEKLASQPFATVFSIPEKGALIQTYGHKRVLLDAAHFDYQITSDMNSLLYTRNLSEARRILDKYTIRYIYLDGEVKRTTWHEPDDGLLFTMRNPDTFKRFYDDHDVEIWRVDPRFLDWETE